jgi:uncharacterized protein YjbJ (UPF0337 family)
MKRFMRDASTGKFLTPSGAWSEDSSSALDLPDFLTACQRQRQLHLQNAEYVLLMGATTSRYDDCENTFGVTLAVNQKAIMTTIEIKGDWNITKSKLKQKWAKLTDDDLQCIEGKHDELLGGFRNASAKRVKR